MEQTAAHPSTCKRCVSVIASAFESNSGKDGVSAGRESGLVRLDAHGRNSMRRPHRLGAVSVAMRLLGIDMTVCRVPQCVADNGRRKHRHRSVAHLIGHATSQASSMPRSTAATCITLEPSRAGEAPHVVLVQSLLLSSCIRGRVASFQRTHNDHHENRLLLLLCLHDRRARQMRYCRPIVLDNEATLQQYRHLHRLTELQLQ